MAEADTHKTGRGEGALVRACGRLMALPRAIIGALILISIVLNFANVIGRYIFLEPLIWAEEVMVFIMVWCVFIGAVLVSWDDRHLRMDILALHLKGPWRRIVNGFVAVTSLAIFAFVAVQSWKATSLFAELGQKSNTAEVPMVIPHAALAIGFGLMFVAVAVRFRAIASGTLGSETEHVVQETVAPAADETRR